MTDLDCVALWIHRLRCDHFVGFVADWGSLGLDFVTPDLSSVTCRAQRDVRLCAYSERSVDY